MKISRTILWLVTLGVASCASYEFLSGFNYKRTELSGGAASVHNSSGLAYSLSIPDLTPEQMEDFTFGNRLFNTNWVTAPSSTHTFDGLGATFNRASCSSCHFKDGSGRPPAKSTDMMESMLVRLSGADGKPLPNYGDQLQDRSILGVPAEGFATVSYKDIDGKYPDGKKYKLHEPIYKFNNLKFGEFGKGFKFSPRVAPAVFGLGLLEAVPEKDILARADANDSDNDGISGRPNFVENVETSKLQLGRFGWKANKANIRQQVAGAFNGDIGITTSVFPKENCPDIQKECKAAPNGGSPEVSDDFLKRIVNYNRTLAVPVARNLSDKTVIRGEDLFITSKCSLCHVPTMKTGESDIPQLANQVIHPFTDMLLHDMGEALADNRPDNRATGKEWRTAPLWGIGLQKIVNGHTRFLHDGRAEDLEQAILWHGGEAENSKQAFMKLSEQDRKALIKFLKSL